MKNLLIATFVCLLVTLILVPICSDLGGVTDQEANWQREGRLAREAGVPTAMCPYTTEGGLFDSGPEPRKYWLKGWNEANGR